MSPIKHYECKKCGADWLDESEVEEDIDMTVKGRIMHIKIHKGCGGDVKETSLFKRTY